MISKIILLLLAGVVICRVVMEAEVTMEFSKFMKEHNKVYTTLDELQSRYNIFMDNYMAIVEHNRVNKDFELGVNQFADMTLAEIKERFLKKREGLTPCTLKHTKVPPQTEIDWRKKNAVSQVKNQGNCGSCWAFSTTGALEGLHAIKKGSLVEYSEQELVDCSRSYGNEGCNGGDMSAAFEYVKDKGISTEAEYPYEGRDRTCRKKSNSFQVSGCVNVTHNNNDELLEALTIGPVSIAVKANNVAFMYYRSGIIKSGCGRESDELDHGITLVGASVDNGTPYWICKNSWGRSWGQAGYVYIKRDTGMGPGVCGIAMEDSYPVLL